MPRSLRFIPENGALVEVTCRTLHGCYFLRPDPALNGTILGVLGRAQGLVQEIEADGAAERKSTGRQPVGAGGILSQSAHKRPAKVKKSPAPRFHAASKAARQGLRQAYSYFVAAFWEAAEILKAGDRMASFPNGCFPPGLPFVRL